MRVRGSGPIPADVFLCGEAPGYKESEVGRCFVGKSGQELTRYLERAYLERDDLYITNLVKEQPPVVAGKQSPPSRAEIERDVPELLEELAACRPLWIGAIGRVAARWLADVDSMESCHGLAYPLRDEVRQMLRSEALVAARTASLLAGRKRPSNRALDFPLSSDDSWLAAVRVVPLHHPAAALHNPELQPLVWWDIQQFAKYAHGRLHPQLPIDAVPNPDYREGLRGWPRYVDVVGVDTEGSAARPWSVQLSASEGTGRVVRYAPGTARSLAAAKTAIETAQTVVLQNALHDYDVLGALGIDLDWDRVEDTFIMADVLRLVPRGLKAGARRDCGMQMRSYAEVVAPAERRLAREWVARAVDARRCYVCWGRGKVEDAKKVAARAAKTLATGRTFKTPPLAVCRECTDGGLWEPRSGELVQDATTGAYRLSAGWEVQRYLRVLETAIERGEFVASDDGDEVGTDADAEAETDSPRKRVRNWPDEVRTQLEAVCGPLPAPTLDDVPRAEAVSYAARDADATLRRYPILRAQIDDLGLYDAYRLDLDVMPIAAEMQRNGMRINRAYFKQLSDELKERKLSLAADLADLVGRPLNPGSGDQVAALLYGKRRLSFDAADETDFGALLSYELTPEKYTRSGKRGSTDDKTLEGLKLKYADNAELVRTIGLILSYRMCDKIDGTYAEKIPRMCDAEDRVHTRIKIGPATFRWASSDPNLANLPVREKHGEDLGRRVRLGFEAADGWRMCARDYDQIEVRVVAHFSQDATLLRIFREGPACPVAANPAHPLYGKDGKCRCHDPHYITASKAFRVPLEAVTPAQRLSGKNIKFGVIYGITARGLKAQMDLRGLHWTIEECQALIDSYLFDIYPGIGEFMQETHAAARRDCMVRSLFGHLRYTPAVHSSIPPVREEALRQGFNFVIQCTAAELHKQAKRELWRNCRQRFRDLGVRWLMSVYDELLVEAPDDVAAIEETDGLMAAYMTDPWPLDGVSITSGSKWGRSWGELKG